jgi:hypothetical protein
MTDLLEHVYAVQSLKAQYCQLVDRAADDAASVRDAFAALFVADVSADYGHAPMRGADAVADFLCSAIAGGSQWALHMLHTPLIRIDGDQATGDWTVMAYLKRRDGGQVDQVLGRYADTFRLTPDGWRIASVKFTRLT